MGGVGAFLCSTLWSGCFHGSRWVIHVVVQALPPRPTKVHLMRAEAVGSSLYYGGVLSDPRKSSVSSSRNSRGSAETKTRIRASLRAESQWFWDSGGEPWRKPRPAPRRALGAGPSAFRAGGRAYRARAEWPRPTGLRGKGWFRAVGKGGATQPSLTWAAAAAAGSREVA